MCGSASINAASADAALSQPSLALMVDEDGARRYGSGHIAGGEDGAAPAKKLNRTGSNSESSADRAMPSDRTTLPVPPLLLARRVAGDGGEMTVSKFCTRWEHNGEGRKRLYRLENRQSCCAAHRSVRRALFASCPTALLSSTVLPVYDGVAAVPPTSMAPHPDEDELLLLNIPHHRCHRCVDMLLLLPGHEGSSAGRRAQLVHVSHHADQRFTHRVLLLLSSFPCGYREGHHRIIDRQ